MTHVGIHPVDRMVTESQEPIGALRTREVIDGVPEVLACDRAESWAKSRRKKKVGSKAQSSSTVSLCILDILLLSILEPNSRKTFVHAGFFTPTFRRADVGETLVGEKHIKPQPGRSGYILFATNGSNFFQHGIS